MGYGSDSRRVQAILEDEVGRASKDIPALVVEPPTVYFREFGDSALVFTVGVRLRQYSGRLLPIGEIHHRLHARLRAEGIDIPFPTRTVHLQQEGAAEPPPGT